MDELIEFYKWLSDRAIIDDCYRGMGEAEYAVNLYNKSKCKKISLDYISKCDNPHCKDGIVDEVYGEKIYCSICENLRI